MLCIEFLMPQDRFVPTQLGNALQKQVFEILRPADLLRIGHLYIDAEAVVSFDEHLCTEEEFLNVPSSHVVPLHVVVTGSDLAAETAAALAAASLVFQSVDATYAATLLEHAKQLYDFGYNYRGLFSDSITDSQCCYTSTHYEDELVWGAAWLYRATNDQKYLGYVDELYSTIQSMYGFDWDQKFAGAMVSHKAALSRRGALGKYRLCVP
uniref:cellulase n=1 Tax=Timema poppense TaxID=170557 RepID=A0A7R9CQK1_TIMPO|nr:unnamed protein product [Timema poppensis]